MQKEILSQRNPGKGLPKKAWAPYVNDVAFQHYVLSQTLPDCTIQTYFMLVNKSAVAPEDGLNQKFLIVRDGNARVSVEVAADISEQDLKPSILTTVNVSDIVNIIQNHPLGPGEIDLNFDGEVKYFMRAYKEGKKLPTRPGSKCKSCEFRCTGEQREAGLLDGFRECWSEMLGWQEANFQQDTVLDIWNCTKAKLLEEGKVSILDVAPDDNAPNNVSDKNSSRLTRFERQSMQLEFAKNPEKEVAEQIGANSWTILNWETGQTKPLITSIPAIVRFLGYNSFPQPTTLSQHLIAKRREMGWSIKEAARVLGVIQQHGAIGSADR